MDWIKGGRDLEHFSGIISIFNNKGEKISKINTVDGTQINKRDSSSKTVCYYELEKIQKFCVGPYCTTTYYYKEVCTSGNSGDGSNGGSTDGGPGDPASIPSVPIDGDDNDWDTGGGNGDGGVITPTMPDEEIYSISISQELIGTCAEDIIIDFIMEDFSNAFVNDPLINETFDALTNSNSPINIIYVSQDISGNGSTGAAQYNSNTGKWDITVRIDIDLMVNGTKLATSKTILHETIHAYLLYMQKSNPGSFSDRNGNFSALVEGWLEHRNLAYSHHVYMGNLISKMGQQLSYYAINYMGYPSSSNAYITNTVNEYFEYVAWSGIAIIEDPENTNNQILNPVFTANYQDQDIQNLIINTFISENTGQNSNGSNPVLNNNCE
ncbi:hypothetical protein [Zunongwangia profunda]|uniref:hypothetical protein n=1 Tax=Zunongwangia profunda TaxID=398743 RepID=UPI001D18C562|nr:hypothetical protein [Zunongwangia profunda]MCC4226709.1 hypothetical protein [Zunongwangia profunda]